MSKVIEKIAKYLVIATFFVPLIVLPNSYIFPFIVPKILWLRSLSLLIFVAYLLLLFSNWQKYRARFNVLNIFVGLFFLSFAVSTFVGVDWYKSFWDSHERMLGLFTLVHYLLFYLTVGNLFKGGWEEWKNYFRWFLGAGLIVMIIGGMQKVNPELLINRGSVRVSATLGNAIYFSGYGLFLFLIGLLLAIKEPNKTQNFWFWYAVVGSLFGFLGIFWGGTRGTVLGLLAAFGVGLLTYVFTLKEHKKLRFSIFGVLVFFVVVLGIMFLNRQSAWVKDVPTVGRLLNSSFSQDSGNTRFMAWGIALDAWKEKPILGWGPNNYFYAFNKYYNPKFLESGWGETWFDNAHSAIFNTLAVQGIIGLLAYVGIFIAATYLLIRAWKNKQIDVHILAVSLAFLVGHFVHNSTVFENPTSYLYFFFFLAFINSLVVKESRADGRVNAKSTGEVSLGLLITLGLVAALVIYATDINPGRANKATLQALMAFSATGGDPLTSYQAATGIPSPHIDDIRNDFARTVVQVLPQMYQNNQASLANQLADYAVGELQKNLLLHPADIRIHVMLSQIYMLRAQAEKSVAWLQKGAQITQEALVYSPKRQQLLYTMSSILLELGDANQSVKILQNSINDDPKIVDGWWRLAVTYAQLGSTANAQATIKKAQELGLEFDSDQTQLLNQLLTPSSTHK